MPVTLHRVFDAAVPPDVAPPGADGVLIYVGQAGFTPHVWTLEEERRFEHLRQFPCWVPDLGADPVTEAKDAIAAVEARGWAKMAGPDTRLILLDGEVSRFPGWYQKWADGVTSGGYFPVDYGSYAYVGANMAYAVWAADWNGIPALVPGQTVGGTQYKANVPWRGTSIDLSVISASLFQRGGIGPRRA